MVNSNNRQNYGIFIERILAILKDDKVFSDKIKQFRFGDLPKDTYGNEYPLCYVTTAKKPEVNRTVFGPISDTDKLPIQKIELEFWIVIVNNGGLAEDVQREHYELASLVEGILGNNVQLKDKEKDPLCSTIKIHIQGRLASERGKLLEAITIRVRPILFGR